MESETKSKTNFIYQFFSHIASASVDICFHSGIKSPYLLSGRLHFFFFFSSRYMYIRIITFYQLFQPFVYVLSVSKKCISEVGK